MKRPAALIVPLLAFLAVPLQAATAAARAGGHALTGVVVSNGEPLAGASLVLTRMKTKARQEAATGLEGTFRFEGLEDGRYDLDVTTPRGGHHRERVEMKGDRTIRVVLRMASLSGRVTDAEDSSPVSGAAISLVTAGDPPISLPGVTTDAHGVFRVPEVGNGLWTLKATREGYAAAERQVRVGGSTPPKEMEIRLKPAQGLVVEAVLASGQPPERIRVAALDGDGKVVANGVFSPGEKGRTRVPNVPPGSWLLLVESDQSATVTLRATVPGPAVKATLPPGGDVRIDIPDLEEGDVDAKVVLSQHGVPYRGFDWDGGVRSEWDSSGEMTVLPKVPAGIWQVEARTPDGRSWSGTVMVIAGAVMEVELKK